MSDLFINEIRKAQRPDGINQKWYQPKHIPNSVHDAARLLLDTIRKYVVKNSLIIKSLIETTVEEAITEREYIMRQLAHYQTKSIDLIEKHKSHIPDNEKINFIAVAYKEDYYKELARLTDEVLGYLYTEQINYFLDELECSKPNVSLIRKLLPKHDDSRIKFEKYYAKNIDHQKSTSTADSIQNKSSHSIEIKSENENTSDTDQQKIIKLYDRPEFHFDVFMNNLGLHLFEKLHNYYKDEKYETANYSFIYRQMEHDNLIHKLFKPSVYIEWLFETFEIVISEVYGFYSRDSENKKKRKEKYIDIKNNLLESNKK